MPVKKCSTRRGLGKFREPDEQPRDRKRSDDQLGEGRIDLKAQRLLVLYFLRAASSAAPFMICVAKVPVSFKSVAYTAKAYPSAAFLRSLGGKLGVLLHEGEAVLLGDLQAGEDTGARLDPLEP